MGIQWVPSHKGILGNALVDILPKETIAREEITELTWIWNVINNQK